MRKFCVALLLVLCGMWSGNVHAQDRCGSTALTTDRAARFPAFQQTKAASEARYQQFLASGQRGGGNERVIPVVVHIIQQSSVAAISDARVQSQIDVLNEDFGKYNADTNLIPQEFQAVAADCNIRFCLATIDPNGCPTNGINRVVDPELAIHSWAEEAALKGSTQWDPHRYLNMWVPVTIEDNLLGYATFPDWLGFDPGSDGVVINGTAFGRGFGTPAGSYNLGRTTTHEVGHWLGLYHTFDGGCSGMSPQDCNSQGDMVCDTPPTSNSNFGCPGVQNTCAELPADRNDQTMNFMDYTDDRCMQMFSIGQRDRFDNYLATDRAFIWSDSNLTLTGCDGTVSPGCLPVAAFERAASATCVGQTVQFTDLSTGPATSWDWTFQGGTPGTSTLQNPAVTWASPGSYNVTLVVTNGIGSDTIVQTASVYVSAATVAPFSENFEGPSGLPAGWYETSQSHLWHWTGTGSAASLGARSVVVPNFSQIVPGLRQDLVSTPYNLSGLAAPILTFDHAYKRKGGFNIDSLQLWTSTDCGDTWQKIWEKTGFALATVSGFQSNAAFVPNPSQWRSDTVDLSAFSAAPELRLMFRSIGGNSQNIYLDNLNLSLMVNASPAQVRPTAVHVFPNPTREVPVIEIEKAAIGNVEATLCDLQGHEIHRWPVQRMGFGKHALEIPAAKWGIMPAGLYILRLEDASGSLPVKIVKISQP